jgi:hypothetical protein
MLLRGQKKQGTNLVNDVDIYLLLFNIWPIVAAPWKKVTIKIVLLDPNWNFNLTL